MSKVIELTEEEFQEHFLWGDSEEYDPVTDEKIIDRLRWAVVTSRIYRKVADGTLWKVVWDAPATEYQDGQDYNATMSEVVEVKEMVEVTKYVPKK